MVVCHCEHVNDRTIERAIADGATDPDAVAAACKAGSRCGGCRETVEHLLARCEALLDAEPERHVA